MNSYDNTFVGIDEHEINVGISKLKICNINDIESISNIKKVLENVSSNYKSSNCTDLNRIYQEILVKLSTIRKNDINNMNILERTIQKYKSITESNSKMLERDLI